MKIKNFIKKYYFLIILLFLGFIPLIDLFKPGLPLTHDGQDHVARIANFYNSLAEGNFVPRWAENLNWGYGHPILMFLYPLPSYLASFFHFIGFSLVDSTKLVFGLGFILSGVFMSLWLKEFMGKERALLGGVLYMFAPYRFVDLYVRGAIGEHIAFVFLPLVFYFVFRISRNVSPLNISLGAISFAFLILSHNAISLMFLPIVFLYIFFLNLFAERADNFLVGVFLMVFLGFGFSAFFWVPAFFEGKYTLRDIVTKDSYKFGFVEFTKLIYSPWDYGGTGKFSVQIGLVHWFLLFMAPFSTPFFSKKKNMFIATAGLFAIFWVSIFLMTSQSQIVWEKLTILQKFQFPWRLLSMAVFTTATLGALSLVAVPKKYLWWLVSFFIILILLVNKDYWHAKDFLNKTETFYQAIYDSSTDTGESAPRWSVRFMEHRPKSKIEIIDGNGVQIRLLERTSTKHQYEILANNKARIRENTLYFPGWVVYIDGKRTEIEFQDPINRGLITFFVEQGRHLVIVKFEETKLRMLANAISLLSSGMILLIILKGYLWRRFQ